MKRTLIQNAVIVNEGRKVLGSVVIENEKIAEILVGEDSKNRIQKQQKGYMNWKKNFWVS